MHVRRPAAMAVLLALVMVMSSCTISVFEEDTHAHDEGDAHEDGDDHAHDEGDAHEDGPIDHHGNPIYEEDERVYEKVEMGGYSVEFTIENFIGVGGRGGDVAPRLIEGEHANLQFHITDTETGEPVAGLRPAVWVDSGDLAVRACSDRIDGYLSGKLDSRPLVDLNGYFVLAMNRDSTISVIDPVVDVGGMTNLYSAIILQGVPEHWSMAEDHGRLFVTLPDLDSIAIVDLDALLVEETIALPARPTGVTIDPDGDRLWIGLAAPVGGVAIMDAESLQVDLVSMDAAAGPIAFTAGRALVGTDVGIEMVDAPNPTTITRIPLPAAPVAIVSTEDGALAALPDAAALAVIDIGPGGGIGYLPVDRGVVDVAVSPDGTWAVAVSPLTDTAFVIEVGTRRITHEIPVAGSPDQVVITAEAAYVHNSESASIAAIPLDEIDPDGQVAVLTIPVGEAPPANAGVPLTAPAITPTPDGAALLLPNPADDVIHLYVHGSQSTLGGFQGHTLQPRAVTTVERAMKEPSPGVYTGSLRIPDGGDYVVAFLLGNPVVAHCFTFAARDDDAAAGNTSETIFELDLVSGNEGVSGSEHTATFELVERPSGERLTGIEDVVGRVVAAGSSWSTGIVGVPNDDGTYSVSFTPPEPGFYNLVISVPSRGLGLGRLAVVSIDIR